MTTTPYYTDEAVTLHHGDAARVLNDLPRGSVSTIVTSPPYYGLRDYGVDGQLGTEGSPSEYIEALVSVFEAARDVLADDGTLWVNLGDSYQSSGGMTGVGPNARVGSTKMQAVGRTRPKSSLPSKNLIGIPWRFAFAMQDAGWVLRNDVIWTKPNAMPESVTDRLASRHEHVFLMAKGPRYAFDLDPIREPHASTPRAGANALRGQHAIRDPGPNSGRYSDGGRNPGDVWSIATTPFPGAHFATFPIALPERCILASTTPGDVVLDPFSGSGTTGLAATKHGRRYVGIDLNAEYLDLSLRTRLAQGALDLEGAAS